MDPTFAACVALAVPPLAPPLSASAASTIAPGQNSSDRKHWDQQHCSQATAIRTVAFLSMIAAFLTAGCQDATRSQSEAPALQSVPYITANEFTATVATEKDVVLVEFCVPVGCFRCDKMRDQIDQLASGERDRITVRRVNLSQHPALAKQQRVVVCPSYIAFRHGEEVFRAAYPTSADLIVAGLNGSLSPSSAE